LWILDDARLSDAQRLVEKALQEEDAGNGETWECPLCGERLEPQFEACWKCSTLRGTSVSAVDATYVEASSAGHRSPRLSSAASSQAGFWVVWILMALAAYYLLRSYTGG
jgi:hypothetical protein